MNKLLLPYLKQAIRAVPAVAPLLTGRARWLALTMRPVAEAKTYDGYYRQIYNRITELYSGEIDTGEFLDAMAEVIQEQLTRAFREALRDSDLDPDLVNEDGEGYADELETMILSEYDFVDALAADVLDAAQAGEPVNQFQSRADLFANRYNDAYNQAMLLIAEQEGGNLEWVLGETDHCETCAALEGIVAKASTWQELEVYPQQPVNEKLICKGFNCGCSLSPTDKRQSPKAYDAILNAVML